MMQVGIISINPSDLKPFDSIFPSSAGKHRDRRPPRQVCTPAVSPPLHPGCSPAFAHFRRSSDLQSRAGPDPEPQRAAMPARLLPARPRRPCTPTRGRALSAAAAGGGSDDAYGPLFLSLGLPAALASLVRHALEPFPPVRGRREPVTADEWARRGASREFAWRLGCGQVAMMRVCVRAGGSRVRARFRACVRACVP